MTIVIFRPTVGFSTIYIRVSLYYVTYNKNILFGSTSIFFPNTNYETRIVFPDWIVSVRVTQPTTDIIMCSFVRTITDHTTPPAADFGASSSPGCPRHGEKKSGTIIIMTSFWRTTIWTFQTVYISARGANKPIKQKWRRQYKTWLFQIIANRYENRQLIVVKNKNVSLGGVCDRGVDVHTRMT